MERKTAMKISANTQEAINLIGEFKQLTNRLFSLAGQLDFPPLLKDDGEAELNDTVSDLEAMLRHYLGECIERDADESIAPAPTEPDPAPAPEGVSLHKAA